MKYLLLSAFTLAFTASLSSAQDDLFGSGVSYNDDVHRKFNLGLEGVVELVTDIKFKSGSKDPYYYYVIPADSYEGHLVSISAVISST